MKPENPLQILQGGLEIEIQLVVQTLHAYTAHFLRLPGGMIVKMSDLGYESRLCNMALVSAAATWDGFLGNIVRTARASALKFNEKQLYVRLKTLASYKNIMEPLARRHCIIYNLAQVDHDYKKDIPSSSLNIGDPVGTELSYLKDASVAFFNTGVELVELLVANKLLPQGQQKTIGEFQGNPRIEFDNILPEYHTKSLDGKQTRVADDTEYATLVQVGELEAHISDLAPEDVALSFTKALGGLVHKVTQAIKTLDGGGWQIMSHEITAISKHLIVTFLVKRQK